MKMLTTSFTNFPRKTLYKKPANSTHMKKGILALLVVSSLAVNAQQKQSLKDLLYSGKLKSDSGTVIRKGDDLSSKIDTSTKKAAMPWKQASIVTANDPMKGEAVKADTAATAVEVVKENVAVPKKSNIKIWKAYTDSLVSNLKTEVLTSKKIKKGDYFLSVDYEIGTNGHVSINNVICDPENSFLQDQVKERITLSPPQLSPVLDSNNQPRKVKKKQNFSITKE